MAGDCCPYIVQYIAIGHDVNHFSQRNLRNGDPNFGSTEDFSRHSSGGDLISLGEGVSYDGPPRRAPRQRRAGQLRVVPGPHHRANFVTKPEAGHLRAETGQVRLVGRLSQIPPPCLPAPL